MNPVISFPERFSEQINTPQQAMECFITSNYGNQVAMVGGTDRDNQK